jgi:hypothetical protein
MRRFTLHSPELHDFVSLGADDHVKLFFGTGPDGRPAMRDYTPRRFDTAKGELVIDFALHEAGPATRWAMDARWATRWKSAARVALPWCPTISTGICWWAMKPRCPPSAAAWRNCARACR